MRSFVQILLNKKWVLSNSSIKFILSIFFFLSGCSALIYQIFWQRMLFTEFGVDLESITIIVSVFMAGLGLGGLLGGLVADRYRTKLLMIYMLIELGIAVFGGFSPWIIHSISQLSTNDNDMITILFSFIILLIPTLLMGAAFPILVTYFNLFYKNIGYAVGTLYFFNTLGGAVGAYFSGFILLFSLGVTGSLHCAVFINLAIALSAFLLFRK